MPQRPRCHSAFTLIELLVVIAVIALLLGILLPTLGGARAAGRNLKCAVNARTVVQGVTMYTVDNRFYPPAYVYGASQEGGDWKLSQQLNANPTPANGYVHWSWALFDSGNVPDTAFTCPAVPQGGAPATNPGANPDHWEDGQVNDLGQSASAPLPRDRQVSRMAYTGNAALFPRNKFNIVAPRRNQLVNPSLVEGSSRGASKVIVATEFLYTPGWKSIFDDQVSKSHRPITPFVGGSAGTEVYNEPNGANRFFYPNESAILKKEQLGANMIRDGNSTLNAVGRHHPGTSDGYGGTANFAFADGHVENMNVIDTLRQRLWGDRFYSITGNNTVSPTGF